MISQLGNSVRDSAEQAFTAWQTAIEQLASALADGDRQRADAERLDAELLVQRSYAALDNPGKNEEERRAKLAASLDANVDYQKALAHRQTVERAIQVSVQSVAIAREHISYQRARTRFLTALIGESRDDE